MEVPFRFKDGSPEELNEFVENLNGALREIREPHYRESCRWTIVGDLTTLPGSEYSMKVTDTFILGSGDGGTIRLPRTTDHEARFYIVKNNNVIPGTVTVKVVLGERMNWVTDGSVALLAQDAAMFAATPGASGRFWWIVATFP